MHVVIVSPTWLPLARDLSSRPSINDCSVAVEYTSRIQSHFELKKNNLAYGKHWISFRVRTVAAMPKTKTKPFFAPFWHLWQLWHCWPFWHYEHVGHIFLILLTGHMVFNIFAHLNNFGVLEHFKKYYKNTVQFFSTFWLIETDWKWKERNYINVRCQVSGVVCHVSHFTCQV